MTELADRDCIPGRDDTPRLEGAALEGMLRELGNDWQLVDGRRLEKVYAFDDFAGALAFTNRVGELAERVDHHPDIELSWGRVKLKIHTHTIDGLSESDFVWAARADRLVPTS